MPFRWIIAACLVTAGIALARDNGQWDATDADVRSWYQTLMQPDFPKTSCCGEADAYWADSFEVGPNGEWVAIITDDRPNVGPLQYRPPRPVGQRVLVPNHKLKYDAGNPTGHGVIFIGSQDQVFCYVTPGGG
jgi:hypothetical protein